MWTYIPSSFTFFVCLFACSYVFGCFIVVCLLFFCIFSLKKLGPGQVSQFVRVSSRYSKVGGSIPGHSTYKNQPVLILSFSPSLPFLPSL